MRLLLLIACLIAAVAPAVAADLGAPPPAAAGASEHGLPACDDPSVLRRIVARQHYAEAHSWRDGLRIEAIGGIRQGRGTAPFISEIPKRHCEAVADLGAVHTDRLYYVISKGQGFAGVSWGVEFCLPRQDPYRVYDADCRVLR